MIALGPGYLLFEDLVHCFPVQQAGELVVTGILEGFFENVNFNDFRVFQGVVYGAEKITDGWR